MSDFEKRINEYRENKRLDSKLLKTLHPHKLQAFQRGIKRGVQAVILSTLLFFFWFFSALFKASK